MKKKIFLLTCLLTVFTYQNVEAQEIRIFKKDSTVIRVAYAELDSIVNVDSYEEEEFVDLGLSVKWASRNLGAKSPEDYGDYYAWGETSPKESYTTENSLTCKKKMSDIGGNPKYDATTAVCGKDVRLPTKAEIQELKENTTTTWTERNGIKGCLVVSKKNGNSIFLPAAGNRYGTSLYNGGEKGSYWSSTPRESHDNDAYGFYFGSGGFDWGWNFRSNAQSVRPVRDK